MIADDRNNKNETNIQQHSRSFSLSLDDYCDDITDSSDSSLIIKNNKKQNRIRSLSAKNIKSSTLSLNEFNKNNSKQRYPLKQLYHFNNNKNKVRRFMKPTLSAYLLTNNPSKLLASC